MKIKFYENKSGRSPILKFIDEQSIKDQAIIVAVLDDIEVNGFNARGVSFRQLEGKLWEIKIKAPSGGFRFLYVIIDKELLFIVHAFKKKTQKTPKKEFRIALTRIREVLL